MDKKILKYISMLLLLVVVSAGFASCSDDDDDDNDGGNRSGNIVGTWKADVSDQFPEQQEHWLGYIFYDDCRGETTEWSLSFGEEPECYEADITYDYDPENGILRCWHGWDANTTEHTNMIYTINFRSDDSFIIDGEDVYYRVDKF